MGFTQAMTLNSRVTMTMIYCNAKEENSWLEVYTSKGK
jgi:hypothetical protein